MSLRSGIAIALLVVTSGVASAATKHAPDPACADHVKKMEGMKTSKERTAYCKANEECTSHKCTSQVAHHKSSTKHHAAAPAPETKPPAN
jgi:hypothetical protein